MEAQANNPNTGVEILIVEDSPTQAEHLKIILERCGFMREGRLRNFRVVRGEPADYWLYSLIPGEATSAA